jgi:hypothetical protein
MQAALSLSDLRVVSHDEPRLQDIKIAEALGFERPRDIRKLIFRNMAELTRFGTCATVAHVVRGNQVAEYWLNEEQALLVSTLSDAPRAAEVRSMLIKVFVAWRRGQLPSPQAPAASETASRFSRTNSAFTAMAERLEAVEVAIGFHQRANEENFAEAIARMPIWKNGRRPNFWGDVEVRTFLTTSHRQMTLADALKFVHDRFGAKRTPSISALSRYWILLDSLHAASPSERLQ